MCNYMKRGKGIISIILCITIILNCNLMNVVSNAQDVSDVEKSTSVFNESKNGNIVEEENTSSDKETDNGIVVKENDDIVNHTLDVQVEENTEIKNTEDLKNITIESNEEEETVGIEPEDEKETTEKYKDENEKIESMTTEIEESKEEDYIATSNIDTSEFIEDKKSETDIATISDAEVDNFTLENITATASFIQDNLYESDLGEYSKLNTIDQITYLTEDGVILAGDIIVLQKDITLFGPVSFGGDYNLDLAGHSISAADNNYALYIENNFNLYDSVGGGTIKNKNANYPVLLIKNATVNLSNGSILGADGAKGGNCLKVYNSNITVDGAKLKSGNGIDFIDKKGGNGGDAILVIEAKKNNFIHIESGMVQGGNGGKGIGDVTAITGAGVCYNGIFQGGKGVGKGSNGGKGGGNGGTAINIKTKDFNLKNLSCHQYKN